MNTQTLQKQFARIGAKLQVDVQKRKVAETSFTLDIVENTRKEYFKLQVIQARKDKELVIYATDVQPKQRHLILVGVNENTNPNPKINDVQKLLCGHDERHWFAASVSNNITKVHQAMDDLRPTMVTEALKRKGVKLQNRNKRHNKAFIRQGEWFFIPKPKMVLHKTEKFLTLKNEPLRRTGGGKPHIIEEVFRTGGTQVYVCRQFPAGLVSQEYKAYLQTNPKAKKWHWTVMRRNPGVYARGTVKHLDHATIYLPFWHQVVMNTEARSGSLAFLD